MNSFCNKRVEEHGLLRKDLKRRTSRRRLHVNRVVLYAAISLGLSIPSAHAFSSVRSSVPTFCSKKLNLFQGNWKLAAFETQNGEVFDLDESPTPQDLHFVQPLLEIGYPPAVLEYEAGTLSEKPLLLYLPGFDGTVVAPFLQFPELSTMFDVRALTVGMSDRSTFDQIKDEVINFIINEIKVPEEEASIEEKKVFEKKRIREEEPVSASSSASSGRFGFLFSNNKVQKSNNPRFGKEPELTSRPVYLMGESFGGILALDVALTLLERGISNLKGLVLVNAATCYFRSKLASSGPKVASLPKLLYPFGILSLVPLFTDEYSFPQLMLILQSKALPSVIDTRAREAYMGRMAFSLPSKLKFMPQETLKWRLDEWLDEGCRRIEKRLGQFKNLKSLRTLIVAGEKDMTLPSIAEAERLSSMIPRSQVHVVEGAGHASTCGSRVDLAALMRESFKELQKGGGILKMGRGHNNRGRTSMKPEAAEGKGVYFGLEKRYNGEEVGLSPLLYWSKDLYRKWDKNNKGPKTNGEI